MRDIISPFANMADPALLQPLVCKAISQRLLMMFAYSDTVRVVEPHLCGINSAGNVVLSAWMLPGYSRSDPDGAWRSFLLDRIWAAQTLPQHFDGARPGFNPADPHMRQVICALQPNPEI
jgi:predicted DNA-binding transcriptional regulator YafY